MTYKKGDPFWTVQIRNYEGLMPRPRVWEGTVTGGGSEVITYTVDGSDGGHRENRARFEERVHRTKGDALVWAARQYQAIRTQATKDAAVAFRAIEVTMAMVIPDEVPQ